MAAVMRDGIALPDGDVGETRAPTTDERTGDWAPVAVFCAGGSRGRNTPLASLRVQHGVGWLPAIKRAERQLPKGTDSGSEHLLALHRARLSQGPANTRCETPPSLWASTASATARSPPVSAAPVAE